MKNKLATMFKYWIFLLLVELSLIIFGSIYQPIFAETFSKDEETYESLKLFSDVLQELEENYVDEVDSKLLIQNAIKGMVSNLDPHSSFMPPESFDELQDDTKGEFGGVGIVVAIKNGVLTVVSPIEGTPAYKAGIKTGDVIIKIDGESTADLELWQSVKKMRGEMGKAVVLTIVRDGVTDPLDYRLIRDIIPMTSVRSATIAPGYGYIWVTNFRDKTTEELKDALKKLESVNSPLKGLILDLRNNPGGLLSQAAGVSDIFLDKGVIVSIKGRFEQQTEVFEAHAEKDDKKYPLTVLINGGSASASEIVAGALQDHKRGLILGTTSFGKGSVQSVKPLRDGFGLKYTIARYYTPSGRSIQAEGIKPDIEVEYNLEEQDNEKSSEQSSMEKRMIREKDLRNHLEPTKKNIDNDNGIDKDNINVNKIKQDKHDKKGDVLNSTDKKERENSNKKQDSIEPQQSSSLLDIDKLKKDPQIQRAFDILVGYGVFSRIK
ncbi:MAG: S41 family peptidase [Desulfamplus sp.]|nr:S41 family peptidase [Desulfamplus sp.]